LALPFILSMLGSAAAGAGVLSSMSPLIAGAIGAGLGSWAETGDIREGLKTGLTSGIMGGIGGALAGGVGQGATAAAQGAGTAGAGTAGMTAAEQAAKVAAQQAASQTATQATQPGLMGMFQNMQPGMTPVANPALKEGLASIGTGPGQVPFGQAALSGFQNGTMTGAGLGTAFGGMMAAPPPGGMDIPGREERRDIPQAEPANRTYTPAPGGWNSGYGGEWTNFNPRGPIPSVYKRGGRVRYQPTGLAPVTLAAGGIADAAPNTSPAPVWRGRAASPR